MYIQRLKVNEGFLDGLDLEFVQGLNVLIGGRGVGKTSVIELIRFGLGVTSNNDESIAHAMSVLQSGKLTIEIVLNGQTHIVHRTANDPRPICDVEFPSAVVFSQKEIESLGVDSDGRLELIDSFIIDAVSFDSRLLPLEAKVRSLCTALLEIRSEIEELSDRIPNISALKETEAKLHNSQKDFAEKNAQIKTAQERLAVTQKKLSQINIAEQGLTSFIDEREQWIKQIAGVVSRSSIGVAIPSQVADAQVEKFLSEIYPKFASLETEIVGAMEKAKQLVDEVRVFASEKVKSRTTLDDLARELRTSIEAFQEGAGQVARELGVVQDQIAIAKNLEKTVAERRQRHAETVEGIRNTVSMMASIRRERFDQRKAVADKLSAKLHPNVIVDVAHLAKLSSYVEAFKDTLRGSGLRYNELIPVIVDQIGPEELIDLLVSSGHEAFAEILDIPNDRAARVLHQLGNSNLGEVLTARIDDDVRFVLRDGASLKPIEDLSIGQRCTVALSVILENKSKVLLIDQPEDHLDNEYIANTLIQSLRRRSDEAQTIVSSHNANIPVLGDANKVICLNSNGRKGFVNCEGSLSTASVVGAIEGIMEGGKEAFDRRATFYGRENS